MTRIFECEESATTFSTFIFADFNKEPSKFHVYSDDTSIKTWVRVLNQNVNESNSKKINEKIRTTNGNVFVTELDNDCFVIYTLGNRHEPAPDHQDCWECFIELYLELQEEKLWELYRQNLKENMTPKLLRKLIPEFNR